MEKHIPSLSDSTYEELEQKDYYYHKLIGNGREVMAIVDKEGIVKFISSNIEREFGYHPSELINQSGLKHIHPEDLEKVSENFEEVLRTPNKRFKAIYRHQHKDGGWLYVENFVQNLLEDEYIEGIIVNFRNVDDFVKNEQKVSEKEQYYRSLIENSSDIISIVDAEGKYRYLSNSFEKHFGYPAKDFIGKDVFQYIHPEDVEEIEAHFKQVKSLHGHQTSTGSYRIPDSQGRWMHLSSTVHNLIEDKVIQGMVLNTRIVDDKVLMMKRLQGREKYYRLLIENSMDLIAVRDENAIITYCSPSTRTILGYTEGELIGTTGFQLIHPDDLTAANKDWQYLMENPNEVLRLEQKIRRKDGSWLFIEARVMNLLHVEDVKGVVSNFSNISQRKEVERMQKKYKETLEKEVANKTEQLKEQNKTLQEALAGLKNAQVHLVNAEKMASLGQLTAGIAHEINNPINFVSGNIYPLKMDFQDLKTVLKKYRSIAKSENKLKLLKEAEKYADEVDMNYIFEEMEALIDGIEEGANRTRDIVVGLRNFSRLDEDTIKLANIHKGLDATLVILKNEMKKGVFIEKEYDLSIGEIECSPGKLNQVFMNLLTNAIQAVKGDGIVRITTKNNNGYVKIAIKDTGVGMTQEVKEKIFEPFFTTKDIGQGTGLGLSITYGIIEQHKGKIIVNSEFGKGSEFVVILPKHQV